MDYSLYASVFRPFKWKKSIVQLLDETKEAFTPLCSDSSGSLVYPFTANRLITSSLSCHRLVFFFCFWIWPLLLFENKTVTTPWLLLYPVYLQSEQITTSSPPPLSAVLTKPRRQSRAVCVFKHGLGPVSLSVDDNAFCRWLSNHQLFFFLLIKC